MDQLHRNQATAAPEAGPPGRAASPAADDVAPLRLPDVPRWFTLGFAPVLALLMLVFYFAAPYVYLAMIRKEGPIEWATVLIVLPGIVAGFMAYRRLALLPARWLRVWVVLLPLGLLYIAGEELSWGQHLFFWDAPEAYRSINDQDETNLHNLIGIGTWLEQKPKNLLEVWAVVGAVVVPLLLARRRPPLDPRRDAAYWFWPTTAGVLTAVLVTAVYLPTRLARRGGLEVPVELRLSELQEYYLALLLSIYVLSISIRLRALAKATDSPTPPG